MKCVKDSMENVFVNSMTSNILPAYEKYTKQLFVHIRQTFMNGIIELTNKMESYASQAEFPQHESDLVLQYLKTMPNEIKNMNDILFGSITSVISNDLNQKFMDLEININKCISENIVTGIERSFGSHSTAIDENISGKDSESQTPNVFDLKEHILTLIQHNNINKAFHQALIANDLNLVEFAIEKANILSVFHPCCLEQKVLLSLIQQITADMTLHSEVKQKYLSEAILSLDFTDVITKEHGPKIIKEASEKCHQFLLSQPSSHLVSNVKMLLMAVQGLDQS